MKMPCKYKKSKKKTQTLYPKNSMKKNQKRLMDTTNFMMDVGVSKMMISTAKGLS